MRNFRFISFVLLVLLCVASRALAIEITSVRPNQVYPGDNLYISLSDGPDAAGILIGSQPLDVQESEAGFVYYRVPDLLSGEYTLQLLVNGELMPSTFRVTVLEPVPVIEALTPANIAECAEIVEKEISVVGRNFMPGSRLMIDGALVESTLVSRQRMTFDASPLRVGAHGVQVVNSTGGKSVPFALYVNNVPVIDAVSPGEYFTNHYELVIKGGNFFQQSTLLVTEAPPGMSGVKPRQKVIWGKGRRTSSNNLLDQEAEDYLFYEDCNTLVYYRYPVSGQARELTLKVINPDGKASGSYQLMAN